MAAKRYFDNNWQQFKDLPDEFFEQHSYEEIMEWKISQWELPSSVMCIIRCTNTKTHKVEEYVYRKHAAARDRLIKLLQDQDNEIVVADHESIYLLKSQFVDLNDLFD
jgi:HD-like signal output (HDOD) protein